MKILFLFFVSLLTVFHQHLFSQDSWATLSQVSAPPPRALHTAVCTGSSMIVWGGQSNYLDVKTGGVYQFSTNSWNSTDTSSAPMGRELHTAVWTGSKMIIWGGWAMTPIGLGFLNTGGIYDPRTNSWQTISTLNAPTGRIHHTAVWTGSKMIVWGGDDTLTGYSNTGGVFDPESNSWSTMSTVNAPSAREWHTAVWTGSKMIVWGGDTMASVAEVLNTGGIYDPLNDTWSATTLTNAPPPIMEHTAVWSGSNMLIWGGTGPNSWSAGSFDPINNSWSPISIVNAPSPRFVHTAVWTGNKMIVWGGMDFDTYMLNSGGVYDPVSDSWTPTTLTAAPEYRAQHTAIWTSTSMVIWGGSGYNGLLNSGKSYHNPQAIGIHSLSLDVPASFELFQNYPNPFNPVTKFKFDLPKDGNVTIEVFDVIGRILATLANNEFKRAGAYEVSWDASGFSSGIYFYRFQTSDYKATKKMILIK